MSKTLAFVLIGAGVLIALYFIFKAEGAKSNTGNNAGPGGTAGISSGNTGALPSGNANAQASDVGSALNFVQQETAETPNAVVNPGNSFLSWLNAPGTPGTLGNAL